MKQIWKQKIDELDKIILSTEIGSLKVRELYRKRELLEKVFSEAKW